jgi:hypothetical protein
VHKRVHTEQGQEEHREVNGPVVVPRHAQAALDHRRHHEKGGRKREVQQEDGAVQALQHRIAKHRAEHAALRTDVLVRARPATGNTEGDDRHADQTERGGGPEHRRQTTPGGQQGTADQRQSERQADTDADDRHGLGALFLAP